MGVYTLRPYRLDGDWIDIGSGSLADDSDSTAKYFANQYQYGNAYFDTAPIPFVSYGMVVKSVKLRGRMASSTNVGSYVQVTIFTSLGRVLLSQGDASQFYVNGLTYVEQSGAEKQASFGPADGYIVATLHPVSPITTNTPKFSELYLDVEFVYPPIPTVNFPTGTYTTTSAPVLSWVYFSQDSLPQSAYRYYIYRDDQYTASGFIPGVTPADYDSGIVYSSAKQLTMVPRVNDSYRVYVAVAQTVNGILQWSLLTSGTGPYNDYVIAITPPAAPTVTVSSDNTNARVSITIAGAGAANSVRDVYEVQRSFDGGVTWEGVRADSTGYIESVGGTRIWFDYETANGQSAVYRARTITYDTVGNTLVGAWSSTSSSVSWTSSSSWLKVLTRPDLNRTIIFRSFAPEDYDRQFGVFQGLDSDDAVTVSGTMRARPDAQFTLLTQTEAEEAAIRAILALGLPLLVQASSRSSGWKNRSKYLTVGSLRVQRPTRAGWSEIRDLIMPYTEIVRPDPAVFTVDLGTKTWQDVDDAFASFTALNAAYSTYAEIRA